MKKQFRQTKMVNWFEPRILLQTGIKALVSGLFGNYADRREMEAALDHRVLTPPMEEAGKNYSERKDIWIDFISDTGDGFNATYSVASTASQKELIVQVDGNKFILPRAKILILGGDQVYPTPTGDSYDAKFRVPFDAALPADTTETDCPHLYAIPGNHDWYDGLSSFIKVFCQQRWIGNWQTQQTRSYFALPLPHHCWLWATDIQLNEDIDKPQLDYFRDIAREKMIAGDKVILCTAEPAWVYQQLYEDNTSYNRLRFFIETYITEDKAERIGKTFQLAVVLTGDLHHYSHYCTNNENNESNHYITAGGGGAFMHLTHNLPENLTKLEKENLKLQAIFPSKKDSFRLLLGNLIFPWKNYYFSFFLLGAVYLLFFWLLQSHSLATAKIGFLKEISNASPIDYGTLILKIMAGNPFLSIISIGIIIGFYKFTDVKTGRKWVKLLGFVHGLLQCLLIFLLIRGVAEVHNETINNGVIKWYWQLLFAIECIAGGGLFGGFLFGLYLFVANSLFAIHLDESSSSLVCEDFKNFLRLHITENNLIIYPIGFKKVTKVWQQNEVDGQMHFKGETPMYDLIEKPIHIKL